MSSYATNDRIHKNYKDYRKELRQLCGARSSDTHSLQRRIHQWVNSHEGNPESNHGLGPMLLMAEESALRASNKEALARKQTQLHYLDVINHRLSFSAVAPHSA